MLSVDRLRWRKKTIVAQQVRPTSTAKRVWILPYYPSIRNLPFKARLHNVKKNINFIVFWCNIFEEVNCLLVIWAIPITLYLAANLSLISTILSLFLVGEHKILAVFCMQFLTFQVIHLNMMPIAILRNKKKSFVVNQRKKNIYIYLNRNAVICTEYSDFVTCFGHWSRVLGSF